MTMTWLGALLAVTAMDYAIGAAVSEDAWRRLGFVVRAITHAAAAAFVFGRLP